ncbi:MAG: hypothetical protein ACRERE_17445, partial [Candidatus Entotheonellia bacterium]
MYTRARLQAFVGELPQRLCLIRREAMQSVGCPPFFGRLARALGLIRWVSNQGVWRGVIALPGTEKRRRSRAARWQLAGLGLLAILMVSGGLFTQTARPVVYVVPIAGMIDLGLAPFVQRVLDEAAGADAAAVILEINT